MRIQWLALAVAGMALTSLRCSSESTNEGPAAGGSAGIGGSGGSAPGGTAGTGGTGGTGGPGDSGSDAPAPTCTDGIKNGSEIDTDCGGGCQCQVGQPCQQAGDCVTSNCVAGKCQPPNCTDNLKNGSETDVDCGGAGCPVCEDLKACAVAGDCKSAVCSGNICQAATCTDGVKNGSEPAPDCGSTCPNACDDGLGCALPSDCKSKLCQALKCVAASCTDGTQNGGETDTDCGGACGACNDGLGCAVGGDCKSGVCAASTADAGPAKVCLAPSCSDGVLNGGETDLDCGGSVCLGQAKTCANGKTCASGPDCTSGVCLSGKCAVATCNDATKNGTESDVDCGGSACPACATGKACGSGADCVAGGCDAGKCGSWARRFGGATADGAYAVAVDSKGDVFVGGAFEGSVSFDGGTTTLTSAGSTDGFVVKLSRTGAHLWTKQLTGSAGDSVMGLAVDASDDLLVVGYAGPCSIGGPALTSAGSQDVLIAKLKGGDGGHGWSKLVGGAATDQAQSVAVDSAGNPILVAWSTSATVSMGGAALTGSGSFDALVAKYSGVDGGHTWSKIYGGTGVDGVLAAAVDANDDVLVTGRFQGTANFDGASLVSAGASDIVVAKLAKADGARLWAHGHGGSLDDHGRGVAVDGSGNAVMAGFRTGAADLGGGALTANGQSDLALASYAATNGSHQWSSGPGGSLADSLTDIVRDGSGFVAIGGYRSSNLALGSGTLPATSVTSAFLVALGASGTPVASRSYAATGADAAAYRVALNDKTRAVVIVGYFGGTLNIDGIGLTTSGSTDAFVASVPPIP